MGDAASTDPDKSLPWPWLAAVLSFLFPGAGQAYAGNLRAASIFALPAIVLVVFVAMVLLGVLDLPRNAILSTRFLIALLVLNALVFAWRSGAIAHAGALIGHTGQRRRRRTIGVVAALLVATMAMHAWVGVVVVQLEGTLTEVFGGTDPGRNPDPSDPPAPSQEPGQPEPTPFPRWDGTERLNILLLGTDAAPGRSAVLTDVILLVSIDPVEETAVMVSVPRDTGFVPLADRSLYADALYPDKVNGLMAAAADDPETWCPDIADDAERCGLRTVEASIALYLGLEIHHYALVDMAGFAEMIDALGGLELCLPGRLVDPDFDGSLTNQSGGDQLILPAGCHLYDGIEALAYARSRKGWIEAPDGERIPQSDFARNERQQLVLLALRRELAEADTFLELPRLLSAIGRSVSTDFPRDRAGDLASLLPLIAGPNIERVVLGYPEFVELPVDPAANYLLVPKRGAIREEMERLFGAERLRGWYLTADLVAPTPTSDVDEGPEPVVPPPRR